MLKLMINKTRVPVTKIKPDSVITVGNHTIQVYGNKYTLGVKTGQKPGPHFIGKGFRIS